MKISKRNQKTVNILPFFFMPTLEFFHNCKKDFKIYAPKLSINRMEAMAEYKTKNSEEIIIYYDYPNYVDVTIRDSEKFVAIKKFSKTFSEVNESNLGDLTSILKAYYLNIQSEIATNLSSN